MFGRWSATLSNEAIRIGVRSIIGSCLDVHDAFTPTMVVSGLWPPRIRPNTTSESTSQTHQRSCRVSCWTQMKCDFDQLPAYQTSILLCRPPAAPRIPSFNNYSNRRSPLYKTKSVQQVPIEILTAGRFTDDSFSVQLAHLKIIKQSPSSDITSSCSARHLENEC